MDDEADNHNDDCTVPSIMCGFAVLFICQNKPTHMPSMMCIDIDSKSVYLESNDSSGIST